MRLCLLFSRAGGWNRYFDQAEIQNFHAVVPPDHDVFRFQLHRQAAELADKDLTTKNTERACGKEKGPVPCNT